ncbi:MAG: PKD domain-containing protein [Salinibacter sp.]
MARSIAAQNAPTASQTASMQVETLENMAFVGEQVHFDLTGIPRQRTAKFTYEWDVYADGVVDEVTEQPSLTRSFAQPGEHTIAVTRRANGKSIATARTTITVIQLQARDPQSGSWLHTVDNPPFFSGEVGKLGPTTLYKFGLGIPITRDWALRLSWAQGPEISYQRRYPLRLRIAAADLQVISKLSEYLRVGLGGGFFIAEGEYRLYWPTKGPQAFTSYQPFISASVGAQWKFILVTVGVHYVP